MTPQFSQENPDTQGGPNQNDPPGSHVGHGQCCAGIIGASHNTLGIRGIVPEVEIVPINIFNDWFIYLGQVYYAEDAQDIADAIDFAWGDAEADILSNSWGYRTTNAGDIPDADDIIAAIGRARTNGRNDLGSIVVFASGNYNQSFSGVTFPANVAGVITVGAVDKNGNIWNYSSRGSEMDLVTPSGDVNLNGDVRTVDREGSAGYETGNYTDRFGGTSAACPQVSGVAALMLSVRPDLTEAQIRTTLQQTATDMGTSGFDNTYGYGRVNAYAAIQSIYPVISGPDLVCSSGASFTIDNLPTGATISWSQSNNLTRSSAHGSNPCTFTANGNGSGWIEATINTDCGNLTLANKTVWVGTPNVNASSAVFTNCESGEGYLCTGCDGNEFELPTAEGFDYIEIKLTNLAGTQTYDQYYWYSSSGDLDWGDMAAGDYLFWVRGHNDCGWSSWTSTTLEFANCGRSSMYYLEFTPNPVITETNVELKRYDKKEVAETLEWEFEIYDMSQIKKLKTYKFHGKKRKINTNGWMDGVYIVRAMVKDEMVTGKFVVKK